MSKVIVESYFDFCMRKKNTLKQQQHLASFTFRFLSNRLGFARGAPIAL